MFNHPITIFSHISRSIHPQPLCVSLLSKVPEVPQCANERLWGEEQKEALWMKAAHVDSADNRNPADERHRHSHRCCNGVVLSYAVFLAGGSAFDLFCLKTGQRWVSTVVVQQAAPALHQRFDTILSWCVFFWCHGPQVRQQVGCCAQLVYKNLHLRLIKTLQPPEDSVTHTEKPAASHQGKRCIRAQRH